MTTQDHTDDQRHAKESTRLANAFADAGAAFLRHMGTGGELAAIPDTDPQQYAVAGTLAMIGEASLTQVLRAIPYDVFTLALGSLALHDEAEAKRIGAMARGAMVAQAPQQSGALSDERIIEICGKNGLGPCLGLAVGRVIEREVLARSAQAAPLMDQTTMDEAALYRDLTGDEMALGFDGVPAALEALRKAKAESTADLARDEALEEAAKAAESTDIAMGMWCGMTVEDGLQTRADIAASIRALKASKESGHE